MRRIMAKPHNKPKVSFLLSFQVTSILPLLLNSQTMAGVFNVKKWLSHLLQPSVVGDSFEYIDASIFNDSDHVKETTTLLPIPRGWPRSKCKFHAIKYFYIHFLHLFSLTKNKTL